MEFEKLESKVNDSQKLQQLQDDIKKEIYELLNNSNLSKLLNEYDISGQKILKLQCSLELTQFKGEDNCNSDQAGELSPVFIQTQQTTIEFFRAGFCYPCPLPGYPRGCWVEQT